ncbi:phospholipase D-like domain-containing protein, partial [Acinetobacter baumannii]|nr:phospholipase D-like domain-containing protein [Acinetobacter baumannii]
GELLDLGVTVYRYHKGFLHSKMVLADDEVVSIGTANFDNRSFYQNFEININIYEKDIAEKFREIFYDDMKTSSKLLRSEY